jgi:hypothetical protein
MAMKINCKNRNQIIYVRRILCRIRITDYLYLLLSHFPFIGLINLIVHAFTYFSDIPESKITIENKSAGRGVAQQGLFYADIETICTDLCFKTYWRGKMGGRSGGVRRSRRQSGGKDRTSYVERKFRVIAINGD